MLVNQEEAEWQRLPTATKLFQQQSNIAFNPTPEPWERYLFYTTNLLVWCSFIILLQAYWKGQGYLDALHQEGKATAAQVATMDETAIYKFVLNGVTYQGAIDQFKYHQQAHFRVGEQYVLLYLEDQPTVRQLLPVTCGQAQLGEDLSNKLDRSKLYYANFCVDF